MNSFLYTFFVRGLQVSMNSFLFIEEGDKWATQSSIP